MSEGMKKIEEALAAAVPMDPEDAEIVQMSLMALAAIMDKRGDTHDLKALILSMDGYAYELTLTKRKL
jgi:hypothetical protein